MTEFLLVKALAVRPGMVKNRDQLIDAAYGENIYVDDRTIDSHVKRVRKKFRQADHDFAQIETLYGIGYRYKESVERTTPRVTGPRAGDHCSGRTRGPGGAASVRRRAGPPAEQAQRATGLPFPLPRLHRQGAGAEAPEHEVLDAAQVPQPAVSPWWGWSRTRVG